MEKSKIPMLCRFDTISQIMPYYARTHKAFLLLSSLCSASRLKLDEFYDEFINSMTEFWTVIELNSWSRFDYSFLPNDLFRVSISCYSEESIEALIKFCDNLRDLKGWYFNKHYMHSKVKIQDYVVVDIELIQKLHPYIDILKSTQVIICKRDAHNYQFEFQSDTLDTNCII